MIFLPPERPFPNDGIRYQDSEAKVVVSVGNGRVSTSLTGKDARFRSYSNN